MRSVILAGLVSTGLVFGAPVTALHAQATQTTTTTADDNAGKTKGHAQQAGDEAKDAAKHAGRAAKHAGKATANGTKRAAKKATRATKKAGRESKNAASAVGHDTKGAVKTSGSEAKKVGSAVKGEVTRDHKNATAKCVDGTYWYATDRTGACKDHGGVADWIAR